MSTKKLLTQVQIINVMVVPFNKLVACSKCGCAYSRQRTPKCPVCGDYQSSNIEDPSK